QAEATRDAKESATAEKAARLDEEKAKNRAEANAYFNTIALAEREILASNIDRAEELLDSTAKEMRGWEYNYLKSLCHTYLKQFSGANFAVAYSPNGAYLATASLSKQTVTVRDLKTGGIIFTIPDAGPALAFSHDSKTLAVGRLRLDAKRPEI